MITIIGAGLGGLTLASILHRNGIEFEIYESDRSPAARQQGGMLDLHADSGQAALRTAGLFTKFQSLILEGGDATRVLDKWGTVWIDEPGSGDRPEVSRSDLRRLLLSSLPAERIHWGAKVIRVRPHAGGGYDVWLAGGRGFTTEVLVGADGGRSNVRLLLSDVLPVYSGVSFVEARIHEAPRRHPELAVLVGKGLMFALSDERGLIAHAEPHGEICVYAALRAPADWSATGVLTRESLLEHFADWDPALRGLVVESSGELMARPIYALPVGHRWEREPGLTLVGDAAHLMSPFAGEGANQAMQDGAELAQAIADHPGDLEAAFAQYEAPMFVRSEAAAAASAAGLEMCLSPTAPMALVDFFLGLKTASR